jgi:K+/H+ antiporter YhaU regulatory subunit KhtT
MLGDKYILTNPSFYTAIEEKDGIIVLGDMQHNR